MIDSDLKSAVSARDLVKIRDFLGVRLQLDHNVFGMFTEGIAYCKANGISETDLYETHDGRNISVANTKENFNLLVGQLATNFSKERLEKTMEIAQAVWPEEQQSGYVQQAIAGQQKSISDSEMHEVVREIPRKTPAANTEEYDSDGARIIRRGSTPTEEYDEDGNKILRKRTIIQNSGNEQHESKSSSTSGGIILAAVVLAAAAIIGAVLFLG